jgi:translation initiation factor 4E
MPLGSDYHLFKQGIEPKWEDAANAKGGKWVISFKKGQREALSDHWLHTVCLASFYLTTQVLAVIGSYFDDSEEITGCVVSVRKNGDRIALWTRDASSEASCIRVG